MRSNRLWIGATCGVAVALGALAVVDAGTQSAGAQANVTVSPQGLESTQNISSAAVKRSDRWLDHPAPLRTTQSTGGNGASTTQLWATLQKPQPCTTTSPDFCGGDPVVITASSGSFTAKRTAGGVPRKRGDYTVDFKIDVSACSWSASPVLGSSNVPMALAAVTAPPANTADLSTVRVYVYDSALLGQSGASPLTDSDVGVQVLCEHEPAPTNHTGVTG